MLRRRAAPVMPCSGHHRQRGRSGVGAASDSAELTTKTALPSRRSLQSRGGMVPMAHAQRLGPGGGAAAAAHPAVYGRLVIAAGVVGFPTEARCAARCHEQSGAGADRAPGLSPEEAERLVTDRLKRRLGMQQLNELRSVSRYGISAVTAVFDDAAPLLAARARLRQERLSP